MTSLRRAVVLVLGIGIIGLASGCAYRTLQQGTEVTPEAAAVIQEGKTTREEVLAAFGAPTSTRNNGSIFFYSWTRVKESVLKGFGESTSYTRSLVVELDQNGIVKSYELTRGIIKRNTETP